MTEPRCTCNGLRRPHAPGVRWCMHAATPGRPAPQRPPAPPEPEPAPTPPPRPRVALELAAARHSWHVRLATPWLGVQPPATMGLVYQAEGAWQGRYYVAQSPEPSVPVPASRTRPQAVARVVDAWVAHVPVLGQPANATDP